jgi:hypothetical protein
LSEISADLVENLNRSGFTTRQAVARTGYNNSYNGVNGGGYNNSYTGSGSTYNNYTPGNTNNSGASSDSISKKLAYIMNQEEGKAGKALTAEEAVPGRKIKHAKFGVGTIVSANKDGKDVKLTIAFDSMGIKIFLLSMTPLELI